VYQRGEGFNGNILLSGAFFGRPYISVGSSATNGGIFAWSNPVMKNKGFEIIITRCCGGENLRSSSGEIRKFRCMPL
jgi:hypothetical protein